VKISKIYLDEFVTIVDVESEGDGVSELDVDTLKVKTVIQLRK